MIPPVEVYLVLHLAGFLILGLVQVDRLPYSWVESNSLATRFTNNVGHSKVRHLMLVQSQRYGGDLVQVG